jgi:protein-disulfide isomerase
MVGTGVAWLVFDSGSAVAGDKPNAVADMPKAEFEGRVREYLLKNPEIIVEAMERLKARQQTAQQRGAQAVLKARSDEIFRDPASPVGGDSAGDVTIVEFFDYNCSYCRKVGKVVAAAENADRRLRIVYKEFPILGPSSLFAAKAALAAHKQQKYVDFHKALMGAKRTVNEHSVLKVAEEIGIDVKRLQSDMKDPAIRSAIDRNIALARALHINGTPGFVVGENILRGATDLRTLQSLIQRARGNR